MTRAAPRYPPMTTAALLHRLERHFIRPTEMLPGGVFVTEVAENGVMGAQRVDALYCGFTVNSGRILQGFEVKCSRGDWLRELDKPHKADRWADACHSWTIVARDTTIIGPGEIPPGVGLMVPDPRRPTKMKTLIPAAVKVDHDPPWWALRSFVARQDTMRARSVEDHIRQRRGAIEADAVDRHVRQNPVTTSALSPADEVLLRAARRFEEAGINLTSWTGERLTPDMVADPETRRLLQGRVDVDQLRDHLFRPYDGIPHIKDILGRMEKAIDKLGAR